MPTAPPAPCSTALSRPSFAGQALQAQHLRVVFQPQYLSPGLELCGFEALARLSVGERDDEGAWLPPERFLPQAEAEGLMGALTLCMAESACRVLRAWHDGGCRPVFIAVNIEADDLADIRFAPRICRLLTEYRVGPGQLHLELVERRAYQLGDTQRANMALLRGAGVRLAMDDFGTGHSALSQLSELPFDIVKIDKTFLARVPADPVACTLLGSVIDMCLALRKEVVVEGVEGDAQLRWLARLRWSRLRMQGNGLSFPLNEAQARDCITLEQGCIARLG